MSSSKGTNSDFVNGFSAVFMFPHCVMSSGVLPSLNSIISRSSSMNVPRMKSRGGNVFKVEKCLIYRGILA